MTGWLLADEIYVGKIFDFLKFIIDQNFYFSLCLVTTLLQQFKWQKSCLVVVRVQKIWKS